MKARAPKSIDEYIKGFPDEVQKILEKIRTTIRRAAPDAEESISYQIPTFTLLNGRYLIYFAACKKHIGLYPTPRGVEKFKNELARYEGEKGTVRFPLDKPIPFGLISRIVKFRIKENQERAKQKRGTRAPKKVPLKNGTKIEMNSDNSAGRKKSALMHPKRTTGRLRF